MQDLDTVSGADAPPSPVGVDPDEALARGATLGRYLVLERLGVGGMGVVYAAYDPDLDRKVAIKLVRPFAKRRSGEATKRLLREAQAMATLTHPNVATVHDVGTVGDKVFVAMEFVDGPSLRAWLKAEPRAPEQIVEVFVAAGRGLAAAHAQGLVHRDFKPDNVMIRSEPRDAPAFERVVVMDFGLAARGGARKARAEASGEERSGEDEPVDAEPRASIDTLLTEAGRLVGTPAYMPPEQLTGRPVDARSDQFAFCVALYEALYGERPFAADSLQSLVFAVTHGELRPEPRTATVARHLRRILLRGLATDPDLRWPSMNELLAALADDPRRRRRPWLAGLAALGVVAAVLAAVRVDRLRDEAACDSEGQVITEVWNDGAREDLRAALVATRAPYAEDSHARVVAWLDLWTDGWGRARVNACRRARIDETLTLEAYERAVVCFDEQRDRLTAMLEVWARAEAEMVAGAVKSAAGLAQLDPCDDEHALAQRPAPPADEALRAAIADVRRDLARASALSDAGHYGDGLAAAGEGLQKAEAVAWPSIEAEARLAAATIQAEIGEYEAVVDELGAAFLRASAAGDDALAAQAAIALLRVLGFHLARPDEGLGWSKVAEALLHRLGRMDGLDAAALANNVGLAHQTRGDLDAALVAHRRALELRVRVLGPDHPEAAHSYGNLGVLHATRGEYDEALSWHTRALEVRTRGLGAGHPDTARSHNNLGRVHLARGDHAAALRHFGRALDIMEVTLGPENRFVARVLHNLGDTFLARGDRQAAFDHYRRALTILAPNPGHPDLAQTRYALGNALLVDGQPAAALAELEAALALRVRVLGDEHPDTVLTRAAIAVVCQSGYAPAC